MEIELLPGPELETVLALPFPRAPVGMARLGEIELELKEVELERVSALALPPSPPSANLSLAPNIAPIVPRG
jgi:hypothetical protein